MIDKDLTLFTDTSKIIVCRGVDNDILNIRFPYYYAKRILSHVPSEVQEFEPQEFNEVELEEHQKPFAEEAMDQLSELGCITLVFPAGFGTTRISLNLISRLRLRTAILVSSELRYIYFQDILNKLFPDNPNISLFKANEYKSIPNEEVFSFGTIIIDEAHNFCHKSMISPLLLFSPKYLILLTPVPELHGDLKKILQLVAGDQLIYKLEFGTFPNYKLDFD